MRIRTFAWAVVLVAALTMTVSAADVTGKWTAQVPGRDGQTRDTTFNLKQDGAKLTGTMSGMQGNEFAISDGKVSGDDLSFTTTLNFNGNEIKLLFKGKVSGNEIKFTREREGGQGRVQEFTAKRAVT